MRVLLDTNVIVDVLQQREPWFADGQKIFYAIANKQITGCITAKEAADIHFFSRKQFTGQENVDVKARQVMTKLYALFELIDTLGIDCQNAIAIENNDYEDAIMIESAVRSGLDCIVTRNPEHFKPSPIPVYSPSEFVQKLNAPSD
jgi:predicted nucleic acid-binding protein